MFNYYYVKANKFFVGNIFLSIELKHSIYKLRTNGNRPISSFNNQNPLYDS